MAHCSACFNLQLDLQIGGRLSCCGCQFFRSTTNSIIASKEPLLKPGKSEGLQQYSDHRSHTLNLVKYCESSRSSTNEASKIMFSQGLGTTEERQFNFLCFHFINTVGTIGTLNYKKILKPIEN